MKNLFPMLLAAAWIALVAMTLTDFAGFSGATRPRATVARQARSGAGRTLHG